MNALPDFWVIWTTPAERKARCGAWRVVERENGRVHAVYEDCMTQTPEGVLESLHQMNAAAADAARLNRERRQGGDDAR